ncbi:MAG: hypothetical protein U5R06_12460 [candidate division KSB1 bacterium]|nr:hypothetical protein [candidate division KSB1 bacterium]
MYLKGCVVILVLLIAAQFVLAGGIITNTNQSAAFVRNLSRNASTDVDAVYFNPAGLVDLQDGWYFSVSSQTIFQEKTIINKFPYLNDEEFVGEVTVPTFPNAYVVWKRNKLALSLGVGPTGGGGTADYAEGLPSFETDVAKLPLILSNLPEAMGGPVPTSQYDVSVNLEGSSIFWGFQFNAAYDLHPMVSVSAGARYIYAVNTYDGALADVKINPTIPDVNPQGKLVSAYHLFNTLGMSQYAAMVADKEVDVTQTGTAVTPLVGLNVRPMDGLNIGLRYEMNTDLDLENDTEKDGTGMYPDGVSFSNDIPAVLGVGVQYVIAPEWKASVSGTYFFDDGADWEGREELVDNNFFEVSAGTEYMLNEDVTLSLGVLHSQTGVGAAYQTDISHSLTSNTVGLGARVALTEALFMDLGALYTMYDDGEKEIAYYLNEQTPLGSYKEIYQRSNIDFAIGLTYVLK